MHHALWILITNAISEYSSFCSWSAVESQVVMVDPSANVYIVSNVLGGRGMVVKLPNDAWDNSNRTWVSSNTYANLTTHHHDPTGGDISPDGKEVILKGIHHIYYWQVGFSNGLLILKATY